MNFSENELHILNVIALSSEFVTAYELRTKMAKDYSTIHKTCKKLIDECILDTITDYNDKNAPKKFLKFTLFGFCVFVTQCKWFFDIESDGSEDIIAEYDDIYSKQKQFLKRWKHLHEAFDWYYTCYLKLFEKNKELDSNNPESEFPSLFLHKLYFICKRIIDDIYSDFKIMRTWSLERIIDDHDIKKQLYIETFDQILDYDEDEPVFWGIPLNEVVELIKMSNEGLPIIKEHLKRNLVIFEIMKNIDNLL
jgi:hypothetical protein